jgi:hypothetical protein
VVLLFAYAANGWIATEDHVRSVRPSGVEYRYFTANEKTLYSFVPSDIDSEPG